MDQRQLLKVYLSGLQLRVWMPRICFIMEAK